MRSETSEYPLPQTEEGSFHAHDQAQETMTPARRAALDALEREFRDLLNAAPR